MTSQMFFVCLESSTGLGSIKLTLTLSPQNTSATFLFCFYTQSAPMSLTVSWNVFWVSNSLDPDETPSFYSNIVVHARLRVRQTATIFHIQSTPDISNSDISNSAKLEASIWIKTTFWLLSPTIIWRWILFYKSKLPEVQIKIALQVIWTCKK